MADLDAELEELHHGDPGEHPRAGSRGSFAESDRESRDQLTAVLIRAVLELENLALRHQLNVLRRQRPGRPRLSPVCGELLILAQDSREAQAGESVGER